ncbi:ABC transporter permease [Spongiactinospora sp. TRM90649]|uniref:MlaE family ABC transporter permease n=1 Tax=Spongiactinospora sp. TRM90649 TaxID=3031114 RepID=UPI0023F810DC|nr:ABC transporter permease [Spongiactinospora sp. TRM90649]MDF5755902.1 ABC transporter permease [Spongiactinospora sp. TRM90649]
MTLRSVRHLRDALGEVGDMSVVALEGLRRSWDVRGWFWEFVRQCWFLTRVTSLPVLLVALPLGATVALQVGDLARQLGAAAVTGSAVSVSLVREVAPLASALLIAGAGGSAMTSDIGARNIRDELDAMRVMAVNPIHRLVTPRLWAAATVAVLLVPLVILAGAAGGYYFNVVVQGVTPGAYFDGAFSLLVPADLAVTLLKAAVFGFVAAVVACHFGMTCHSGPAGVGRAVTRSTVVTFMVVFTANYVISTVYFLAYPPRAL